MKKLVKRLIINKFNAKFFLKPLLNIDRYLYFLIGQYSSLYYDGKHPKHDILKYQEWFCNNLDPSWNVIDVGSNTGTMAEKMSKKVKKVYGIEINETLHQKAQKNKSSNLTFICADATKFDYNRYTNSPRIVQTYCIVKRCQIVFASRALRSGSFDPSV